MRKNSFDELRGAGAIFFLTLHAKGIKKVFDICASQARLLFFNSARPRCEHFFDMFIAAGAMQTRFTGAILILCELQARFFFYSAR